MDSHAPGALVNPPDPLIERRPQSIRVSEGDVIRIKAWIDRSRPNTAGINFYPGNSNNGYENSLVSLLSEISLTFAGLSCRSDRMDPVECPNSDRILEPMVVYPLSWLMLVVLSLVSFWTTATQRLSLLPLLSVSFILTISGQQANHS